MLQPGNLLVIGVTVVTVLLVVLLHYEVLSQLNRHITSWSQKPRPRMLIIILGLLLTHVVEIWIFAGSYWFLGGYVDLGELVHVDQAANVILLDYVYFSAAVYTTLGFGDIIPTGQVRFLAGTEALTGLMLITWSASFTFLEMQRFWRS